MPNAAWIALAIVLSVLGLSGSGIASGPACEPISIYAAASTTEAVEQIAAGFERETGCSVTVVTGGSSTLARQIAEGAPADLFLSANPQWMDWLISRGVVRPQNTAPLLGNLLVFIAPSRSNPSLDLAGGDRIADLLGNGRLAIGEPDTVPAGIYAKQALVALHQWPELQNRLLPGNSVRTVLAWVAGGEAPLGIVYASDALMSSDVRIVAAIDSRLHDPIVYPLALIGSAATPVARQFGSVLRNDESARIFRDHGFTLTGR